MDQIYEFNYKMTEDALTEEQIAEGRFLGELKEISQRFNLSLDGVVGNAIDDVVGIISDSESDDTFELSLREAMQIVERKFVDHIHRICMKKNSSSTDGIIDAVSDVMLVFRNENHIDLSPYLHTEYIEDDTFDEEY